MWGTSREKQTCSPNAYAEAKRVKPTLLILPLHHDERERSSSYSNIGRLIHKMQVYFGDLCFPPAPRMRLRLPEHCEVEERNESPLDPTVRIGRLPPGKDAIRHRGQTTNPKTTLSTPAGYSRRECIGVAQPMVVDSKSTVDV
jgi:hypothetical protein